MWDSVNDALYWANSEAMKAASKVQEFSGKIGSMFSRAQESKP